MKKRGCPFCSYKEPSAVAYSDPECYAAVSYRPINDYHVLVIPRGHYANLTDLPDELAAHLFLVTKRVSAAVRKACKPDAVTHISDDDISHIGLNEVEHFKIHVIPRFRNDRVSLSWGRGPDAGMGARARTAKEIKRLLK